MHFSKFGFVIIVWMFISGIVAHAQFVFFLRRAFFEPVLVLRVCCRRKDCWCCRSSICWWKSFFILFYLDKRVLGNGNRCTYASQCVFDKAVIFMHVQMNSQPTAGQWIICGSFAYSKGLGLLLFLIHDMLICVSWNNAIPHWSRCVLLFCVEL